MSTSKRPGDALHNSSRARPGESITDDPAPVVSVEKNVCACAAAVGDQPRGLITGAAADDADAPDAPDVDSVSQMTSTRNMAGAVLIWLETFGSDITRDRIGSCQKLNPNFPDPDQFFSDWVTNTDFDFATALKLPFFKQPRLPAPAQVGVASKMSVGVTQTERTQLKDPYVLETWFGHWSDEGFKSEIMDTVQLTSAAAQRELGRAVRRLLVNSSQPAPDWADERVELISIYSSTRALMSLLGIGMTVPAQPEDNFTFFDLSNNSPFLTGEGKKSANLPLTPTSAGESANLCIFGLCTALVRRHKQATEVTKLRKSLKLPTETKADLKSKSRITPTKMSRVANEALKLPSDGLITKDIGDSVQSVYAALSAQRILPKDALSLWTAVMQACFASVRFGFKYGIVTSGQVMWFLDLDADSDQLCTVYLTDGMVIGSPRSNETFLSFLVHAKEAGSLAFGLRRSWQKALKIQVEDDDVDGLAGGDEISGKDGGGDKKQEDKDMGAEEKTDAGNASQAHSKKVGATTTEDFSSNQIKKARVVSKKTTNQSLSSKKPRLSRMVSDDFFCGEDKYGVIPYFDQISEVVDANLGVGLCGTVKKIKWQGGFAAVKQFMVDPHEHEKTGEQLYKHELHVMFELKTLWGVNVPKILFHLPWHNASCIGYQVGEPMEDDMSLWSTKDRSQASESLEAIEKLGWVQTDIRGRNFVCLTNRKGKKRIAAIDMESFVRVGTKYSE